MGWEETAQKIPERQAGPRRQYLNCLDLQSLCADVRLPGQLGDNLVSPCLLPSADLVDGEWRLAVGKDNISGSMESCGQWMIYGLSGSISYPHFDAGAFWTMINAQEDRKLWLLYDNMSAADQETYSQNWHAWDGDKMPIPVHPDPSCGITPLILEPGWSFLQPPGRVHAPYSLADTVMTGAMYMETHDLASVARQVRLEERNGQLTNEDPQPDLQSKLVVLLRLHEHAARERGDQSTLNILKEVRQFLAEPPVGQTDKGQKRQKPARRQRAKKPAAVEKPSATTACRQQKREAARPEGPRATRASKRLRSN